MAKDFASIDRRTEKSPAPCKPPFQPSSFSLRLKMNIGIKNSIASLFLIALSVLLDSCGPRDGYRVENGTVVLSSGWPATTYVLDAADSKSFTAINEHYGKDKVHVFYYDKILPNADPGTFEYLGGAYSRDKNRGYCMERLISDDGFHFSIVPNPHGEKEGITYARDSHTVYQSTSTVPGADPATFVFVPMFNGYHLAHDRNHVYFNSAPLEGVDGSTFQKVTDCHFKNSQGAWALAGANPVSWAPMPEVDLPTFTAVGQFYAKDKQYVYFDERAVEGADPATFKETDYLKGQDKHGKYTVGHLEDDKAK